MTNKQLFRKAALHTLFAGLFFISFSLHSYGQGIVETYAGSEVYGFEDGLLEDAEFNYPIDIAKDSDGNFYVLDFNNYSIRKITSAGMVSTLVSFFVLGGDPTAIAIGPDNTIYVGIKDGDNSLPIRKISGEGGDVSNVGEEKFKGVSGIVVDTDNNLYISSQDTHTIYKLTPSGVKSVVAGNGLGYVDGIGIAAKFRSPWGLTFDKAGNLYVADHFNNRIRKIELPSGEVSTFAGSGTLGDADGTRTEAQFKYPRSLTFDGAGNLYVTDLGNYKIREITPDGVVTTVAGSNLGFKDGDATTAQFAELTRIIIDADGNLYVADAGNNRIRKIIGVATSVPLKVAEQGAEVWSSNGAVHVTATKAQSVELYSVSGQLVKTVALPNGGNATIAVPQGIYLIRIGNTTKKIVVF